MRPGRPILRRDQHTLQVGLGATAVLLADRPPLEALLSRLDSGVAHSPDPADQPDLSDPEIAGALERLRLAGHLQPTEPPPPRAAFGLSVHGPGLGDLVEAKLDAAGLTRDDATAEAWLVVAAGPVSRTVSDDLVQSGRPHVFVAPLEGTWRVGPFVVPGVTACQRCVDTHEAADDPRRGLLLTQAARAAVERPERYDALLADVAVGLALRDLRTYLDGGEPATWSTTIDLPAPEADRAAPLVTPWLRHLHCGCAWDLLVDLP